MELSLAVDPLAIDVGPVEAPKISQHELGPALLDDAVLLRDDLVEQLDGVAWVPPQAVVGAKFHNDLALRGSENNTRHSTRSGYRPSGGRTSRP